tara:strand:- start:467 stop:592 length:126 start_codon:yes stop_codon:yes gene_type:complete
MIIQLFNAEIEKYILEKIIKMPALLLPNGSRMSVTQQRHLV